jgi:tRNA pseudouridine38-40 synthase
MIQRYFIKFAFDGTRYHGWQIQSNSLTVQQVMNDDLSLLTGEDINVSGCGRTDTGVHAREFYAHFDSEISNLDEPAFAFKMNSKLPRDIAVDFIRKVQPEAHARFSAVSRTYEYHINRQKDPFNENLSHYLYGELNLELMQKASDLLLVTDDFTSFSKVDTDVKTNICDVRYAIWEKVSGKLVFTITADRFLRNMVRAVVGTLIEIGFGKLTIEEFKSIIDARDRSAAGTSAPAKGLFLTKVEYPEEIYLE